MDEVVAVDEVEVDEAEAVAEDDEAEEQALKKRNQIIGTTACLVRMAKPFRALT